MIFGIDLGTTNSLIGVGETLLTGLVSSNVDIDKQEQVARDVVGPTIVSSYKTNMSIGSEGALSIKCSTVILKELKRQAERRYGEDVKDVVISVPAYFSTTQRQAVYKAAKEAGLNVKSLINEPTAAALYVCRDVKDLIVVFDLGGGTFDVTIIDSRVGSYSVVATDGKNLGGDDFDKALTELVLNTRKVQYRKRTEDAIAQLKMQARLAKEQIQKPEYKEVYIDMSQFGVDDFLLTEDIYKELIEKVFGSTITKTEALIAKYLPACEEPKLVFVGGSTNCPYLRARVKESIVAKEVQCDVNRDYVVAKGVALYAEMLHSGRVQNFIEDVTKRLCIEDNEGKSLTVIESNATVPCRNSIIVRNPNKTSTLELQLYQGDSIVACKNEYIGTLVYDYGREVEPRDGVVEVEVNVACDGIVTLSAFEVIFGEEDRQSIELVVK